MALDTAACGRCAFNGCDVRIIDCGCSFHVRCTPSSENLRSCPTCRRTVTKGLQLLPMSFEELDAARDAAAALSISGKRGKKRKSATIARLHPEGTASASDDMPSGNSEENDLRTGRWTHEETRYCDKLIEKFGSGELPLVEGIKLNDFLAKMLKSKQSRLTKKMKNAKLSTKTFKRSTGYIVNAEHARSFSELEDLFYRSISCSMERAEIRFHIQKEWRERFSSYCVHVGRSLDAGEWLFSVEEIDRRMSRAKDAARMARRKLMMGYALSKDSRNPDQGVFIDSKSTVTSEERMGSLRTQPGGTSELLKGNSANAPSGTNSAAQTSLSLSTMQASPFLFKVVSLLRRKNFPFEHVDAWVPSFVPQSDSQDQAETSCRLCYAGSATADVQLTRDGRASIPLSADDEAHLLAFGQYSEKFSFDVGCGLPGRVYRTGVSSWEQNVQNAPHQHFERCGGAAQWGIKTVLGMPIPSPNVGRIVVVFYSLSDRNKNQDIVTQLCEDLTKLLPCPKWKLVVDIGKEGKNNSESEAEEHIDGNASSVVSSGDHDSRVNEIVALIGEQLPAATTSLSTPLTQGFTSLRLMLLKPSKSTEEIDMVQPLLASYSSYLSTGRPRDEVAKLLVRDYAFLSQQQPVHSNHSTSAERVLTQMSPLQMLSTAGSPALGFLEGMGQAAMLPMLSQAAASHQHSEANLAQDAHSHSYSPHHNHNEIPGMR